MSKNEDYGIVLSQKVTKDNINTANVMGTNKFTLINIELNEGVELRPQEKILITKDSDKVKKLNNRLSYDDLSNDELQEV